jgi:adenine-specific DNA-methyltransferase
MSENLDMQSPNWANLNSKFIAERFPNCVTESADGIKIDFDLLKQELSNDLIEGTKERYRLEWPGKKEAIVTANLPTTKTLRPIREDSVNFDNTENIYIEGDNLEVLKLLQESYLGKIKIIYIDPPYNTGKDFVYKDNFSKDAQDELLESGQKDESNQRLVVNPETAGRYHSDWLTMMYPRLKLARNLLTEDGVIFMSIDDNEVHNLRKISDEVFGEANFITNLIWHKKYGAANDAKYFSDVHDHILVYSKNRENWRPNMFDRPDELNAKYKNPDNDPNGVWIATNLSVKTYSKTNDYIITGPTGLEFSPPPSRAWVISEAKYKVLLSEGRITFGKDGNSRPYLKTYLSEVQNGIVPTTIWSYNDAGHNIGAKSEIRDLFSETTVPFDTPKPTKLLSRIISVAESTEKKDIILDFFSGSGTTAHSTLHLNSEDGGKRKFIMVQLPEKTEEKSEAFKAGYKNICEIGKERIRRATKKIKEESNADIDYGFRVYRLSESNMQDVYYKPQDYKQASLELFSDNVKTDRTADDLLAQVMLDWGLPLSLKIEQVEISGKEVFKVAENSLFACFDKNIDEQFAKELANSKPLRVVFRDAGFKDDTAKTNVKQLIKQLSPETEMKVI